MTESPRSARKSTRLDGYDYSSEGWYFVTICCHQQRCLFGRILNEVLIPTELALYANSCWFEIPSHYPEIVLDAFVIMPNHVHGIFWITRQMKNLEPGSSLALRPTGTARSVGSVVRAYKSAVTKYATVSLGIDRVWQRNYWDHIIRGKDSLDSIRIYIINNPVKWQYDRLHVDDSGGGEIP